MFSGDRERVIEKGNEWVKSLKTLLLYLMKSIAVYTSLFQITTFFSLFDL